MNLYENVGIGNFIHMMGFKMGCYVTNQKMSASAAANLFQQTPADSSLADYMHTLNGRSILIEFKRPQNHDDKEKVKVEKLKSAIGQESEYLRLSLHGHWFGMVGVDNQLNLQDWFVPYISHMNPPEGKIPMEKFIDIYMASAITQLPDPRIKIGIDGQSMRRYLDKVHLADSQSSGGRSNTSVIVANLSADGLYRYAVMPDVSSLFLKKEHALELIQEIHKSHTKEKSRGFERG